MTAAFLTLAAWLCVLGGIWWLWASLGGPSEPARPVINVVFAVSAIGLVWYLLYGDVPPFLHFGPHHADGILSFAGEG
jgi:hypothetical protein